MGGWRRVQIEGGAGMSCFYLMVVGNDSMLWFRFIDFIQRISCFWDQGEFPRQTVGLWIRHVGCRLGPSVIPRGIVYLYFAAVFGFIQRHVLHISWPGLTTFHAAPTLQGVWDISTLSTNITFDWVQTLFRITKKRVQGEHLQNLLQERVHKSGAFGHCSCFRLYERRSWSGDGFKIIMVLYLIYIYWYKLLRKLNMHSLRCWE